jgi:predicted ArsR family transcriptional regulator
MTPGLQTAAASLGALQDDVRRKLYLFIREQARPISRDEAAREAGISRKLAAFHLDKLVERGLLDAHYARPPGRSGPGAGRPSKLYQVSENEIGVFLPERRYDVVGQMLVEALATKSPEESGVDAARRVARAAGEEVGQGIRRSSGMHPAGAERALSIARDVLREHGFEPYESGPGEVSLRNCPFHILSQGTPELVCGLNQAFIDGILRGLGNRNVEARLEPQAGECCVRLCAGGRR